MLELLAGDVARACCSSSNLAATRLSTERIEPKGKARTSSAGRTEADAGGIGDGAEN